jgi:16S rRNA (cytosine967-C5)-methyltransferase
MCAGPGGKAALISDSVPPGVTFTSVELHEHRATLIEKIISPGTSVIVADARTRPWGNLFFDRVLVDAPCTGLGALRRRPEARWRKQASDLRQLNPLQEELINAALDSTRSGGIVCYATCSPAVEETVDILESVLSGRSDAQLEDARPLFPGVSNLGAGPTVQLWPHVHGTDAMFFALIRRN